VVLDRLIQAVDLLPAYCGFLVWDVYRPRSVQATIFNWMSDQIKKNKPHLSAEENYFETCKFASPPSAIGEHDCAPHLSGGAIDLTLYDMKTSLAVEMGTVFDDCTEKAHRDYFNRQSGLSTDEREISQARDTLRNAMEETGFVSYEYEWWHFDLGDRLWGKVTGNAPEFGPLFGDAEWP
jgi:D-alanyl-D-alanine dipeptidase